MTYEQKEKLEMVGVIGGCLLALALFAGFGMWWDLKVAHESRTVVQVPAPCVCR